MRIFLSSILVFLVVCVAKAQPCTFDGNLTTQLSFLETDEVEFELAGDLSSIQFNLSFAGPTGTDWAADLMVFVYAPNGDCAVMGGWSPGVPTNGCSNLGTLGGGEWPASWNNPGPGVFTHTVDLNAVGLEGSGTWIVVFQNAWVGADIDVPYDMDMTFIGLCEGDCFDPEACNFVPNATIPNNDFCLYAEDLYPSGLYDCDGNCYFDTDGDGVCDALEVPGCQVAWACNFNPQATDEDGSCTYPESNDIDCDGNSLLPQFLTQPQDVTVSCEDVPEPPVVLTQPAPAAVAYYALQPINCYGDGSDPAVSYEQSFFPGDCPGNYTLQRKWTATDCNGLQNVLIQVITVVDNLPPVVSGGLDTLFLACSDLVVFPQLTHSDACSGSSFELGQPAFVTLPGACPSEFTEKKITTLSDECGNEVEVEQVAFVEDNTPPEWITAPSEVPIVTDNLDLEQFDVPVAEDNCSGLTIQVTNDYGAGICPLSLVLTRTFVAHDQCGNTSATFVQTIQEATDLSVDSVFKSNVTCHGGSDGHAVASATGGVPPYTFSWGGYNPDFLEEGVYEVTVTDDNLCQDSKSFVITQPPPFSLELTSAAPNCTDPNSGSIDAEMIGGSGNPVVDWENVNPDSVSAGEYIFVATDASGCTATASVVVPAAEVPPSFELDGPTSVTQGDSTAYYYEFTLGSDYTWSVVDSSGTEEQQESNAFAISLIWVELGLQEVCVFETNENGCVGDTVCMNVFVQDDIMDVENEMFSTVEAHPTLAHDVLWVRGLTNHASATLECWTVAGRLVHAVELQGEERLAIDVSGWAAGHYLMHLSDTRGSLRFAVQH